MIQKLIYIILLFTTLNAQSIVDIKSNNIKINDFKIGYFIDTTNNMQLDNVKKQNFINSSNSLSLGYNAKYTWVKIVIKNSTTKNQNIFIHNIDAFHSSSIKFYELEDNKILNALQIDLKNNMNRVSMDGANAIFDIYLRSNQTKIVYMKSEAISSQFFKLLILDEENSKKVLIKEYVPMVFLMGVLMTLAFYNLIIYISLKYKEYLYYSLYLFSSSIWIIYMYGPLAHYFEVYGSIVYIFSNILILLPILLSFFIKSIFKTEIKYPRENKLIDSIIYLFLFNLLYTMFDYEGATRLTHILFLYSFIVFISVAISIHKQGNNLAKYFLIANISFGVFETIGMLFYNGFLNYTHITSHAIGIGLSLEAMGLTYLLSYRIKLIQRAKRELFKTLEEKVKQRTSELEFSNYEFQHVLDTTMEGICIIEDGKCIDINNAGLVIFGFKNKKDILGISLISFIAPSYRPLSIRNIQQAVEEPYESIALKSNGEEFPVMIKGHNFKNNNRTIHIMSLLDLTDMKNNEKELKISKQKAEESTKIKSNFLANMSHEIRTPMNGIVGMTYLIKQTNLNPLQINYINKIEKTSNNLLDIINDILDFSKIEAGKIEIEKIHFDMKDIVNNIINIVELKAEEKDLEFKISCNEKYHIYYGDALKISQIILNLITNAIKFTHKGSISFNIERIDNDNIRFIVKDTGIGLTTQEQSRLFSSFSQADSSTTRKYGGTGLGLSISKELVYLMNGKIWVESIKGKGSSFMFEIELPKGEKSKIKKVSNKTSLKKLNSNIASLKGSNILLVEDNDVNREIIHALLQSSGINIDDAYDGKMALDLYIKNKSKYELILMDIQMPIMDGYEATTKIREIDKNIPIIALSANAMKHDIEKSKEIGMNAHLSKPIEIEKIYKALIKYIPVKEILNDLIVNELDGIELPNFTYLDINIGLDYLGGDKKLYIEILGHFITRYKNFNIDNLDKFEFKRATHTLKGLSQNIGASSLYIITKELDKTQDRTLLEEFYYKLELVVDELLVKIES